MTTAQEHYDAGEDLLAQSQNNSKQYLTEYRTMLATRALAHFAAASALSEVRREQAVARFEDARREQAERAADRAVDGLLTEREVRDRA